MTPSQRREWLTRLEVIEVVDERVAPLMAAQLSQARSLEEIRATNAANHDENRRKLDNVLQLGENQLALLRERERLTKEFEEQRKKEQKEFEKERQAKIDKWAKRVGLLISPAMFYQIINFAHRLWLWHITGHFFASSSH